MFALKLLGGLALECETAPLPAGALQRRRLALLAVLAMGGERGVSRERVQALLWPESSADRARHALEQLLYSTRRDLGRDAVLSSASELRLNSAVVRPDVWKFDEAIRAGNWAEAVALYAGPLLAGVYLLDVAEFERWLDAERLRLEQEYHRALEALAGDAAARGDHAEAVRWWRRRAAAEPMCAPAAIQLMRALAAAGDRAGAIRHARVYGQAVRSMLEVEPDPAVEALASALAVPGGARAEHAEHAELPLRGSAASPTPAGRERDADPRPAFPAQPPALPAPAEPARRSRRSGVRLAGAAVLVLGLAAVSAPLLRSNPPARSAAGVPGPGGDHAAGLTRAGSGTADPGARALVLRARTAWDTRTKDGLDRAVVLYRQATERDPLYADAYAGLAESYAMLGYFGFGPGDAMFAKARAAAQRALELDPAEGEAYAALGQALAWQHAWAESERAYRRAVELAPDNPTVHQWYGLMLAYVGRIHEAAEHTGRASRLDPLSVQINNMYGMMLYHDGDLAGALRQYEHTVNAEPDTAWVRRNPWVLTNYATVAAAAGRYGQALDLLERALRVVPTHPRALLDLAGVYVQMGEPERARAAFARADTTHPHYRVYRAELHALLGEFDAAFAQLDSVTEWPLPTFVALTSDTRFAPLRADPRFARVRARLGLPPR